MKHEVGRRILKEKESINWGKKLKFLADLGENLGYSPQELYRCVKFADKFPDFEAFKTYISLNERNIELSWHQVYSECLYEGRGDTVVELTSRLT